MELKRKQINKYLRQISRKEKTDECKCFICNKNKNLSLHHIIPIEELGNIAWINGYHTKDQLNKMYLPVTFLCEEHHNMIHELDGKNFNDEQLSLDEIYSYVDMLSSIDLTNVPEELFDDYYNEVERMKNIIIYNFVEYGDLTEDELEELDILLFCELGIGENENERDVD